MNLVERISDCTKTIVLTVFKISLDLSWKKPKRGCYCLDVTFNLKTGKYYQYWKQNNSSQHINKQSNHPISIIKQILSWSVKCCLIYPALKNILTKLYQLIMNDALKTSVLMKHQNFHQRYRNRNIIWFNRPFSRNAKTNVRKLFLTLFTETSHFNIKKYHIYLIKNSLKSAIVVCLTWRVLSKIITLFCY